MFCLCDFLGGKICVISFEVQGLSWNLLYILGYCSRLKCFEGRVTYFCHNCGASVNLNILKTILLSESPFYYITMNEI